MVSLAIHNGVDDLLKHASLPYMCYGAECDDSRSNRVDISREPPKLWTAGVTPLG